MPDVRVSLSGGTIAVFPPDIVNVSKKNHDTVTWFSTDGPFGIRFQPASHIPNPTISNVGGRWQGTAGPFGSDVPEGKTKYDVTSPGLHDLDPELDIKP